MHHSYFVVLLFIYFLGLVYTFTGHVFVWAVMYAYCKTIINQSKISSPQDLYSVVVQIIHKMKEEKAKVGNMVQHHKTHQFLCIHFMFYSVQLVGEF